jgi:cytochrome c-type biogenesis protein CcmH
MTDFWLPLAAMAALAAVFFIWPIFRFRNAGSAPVSDDLNTRLAENVRIFREHLAELEANLASQAIDQTQFSQLKLELERNLLEDEASIRANHPRQVSGLGSKLIVGLSLVVIAGGIYFYLQRGSADDVLIKQLQDTKMQQDYQDMLQNREPNAARTQELIAQLKSRLEEKPENLQLWFLLARSYMEQGAYAEATTAYQQLLQRDPQSPMVMSELAQAMFLRDGNRMTPPVVDLAKNALTLDPKNTTALGLLGIDAYGRKDYKATIRYWQQSVDSLGTNSSGGQALAAGIERAKRDFIASGGSLDELGGKSAYALTLKVSIGPKAKVTKDQVVFIYARAWKGSPMPLAISRIKVADLPATITLDETMAMSPAASLANATDVEVVARVSPEGSAQAKVGDWQAKQGPISMKSIPEELPLEINEQLTTESLAPQ